MNRPVWWSSDRNEADVQARFLNDALHAGDGGEDFYSGKSWRVLESEDELGRPGFNIGLVSTETGRPALYYRGPVRSRL